MTARVEGMLEMALGGVDLPSRCGGIEHTQHRKPKADRIHVAEFHVAAVAGTPHAGSLFELNDLAAVLAGVVVVLPHPGLLFAVWACDLDVCHF